MSGAQIRDGQLHVPVIDISSDRAEVAKQVDSAARTVGFMQITGHGIAQSVLDDFAAALDSFFGLDLETKLQYRCPPGINRGYTPPRTEALTNSLGLATAADLFEAINVGTSAADHPDLALPEDVYTPNLYPLQVPSFEPAVTAYFAEAQRVARTMERIFGEALGLGTDYFGAFTDHSIDVLRMNNYRLPSPDVELEPDQLGMGAHTDYGIVTVLWADRVPGLEILGESGGTPVDEGVAGGGGGWYPVMPAPGALLINLGDALARWTNDQWISTMHRVAPPRVDEALVPRRSAAFFHDGNIDAVIATLPSCVDAEHPAHYEPVTVAEHLAEKLAGSRGGYLNPNASREAARLSN
ncbi:MAG TPA: 2-oxoglutarate and iron-dependent oxygenase domain-containing protein [Jatrophihabitans sp.]